MPRAGCEDEDEFQCPSSGECIPESWTCDGITDDCDGNEDENKETCGVEGTVTIVTVRNIPCF